MKKLLIAVVCMVFSGVSAEALTFEGTQDWDITYNIQVRRHGTKELLYVKSIFVDQDHTINFNLKDHLIVGGNLYIFLPSYGGRTINCYSKTNMTAEFINHIDDSNKIVTVDLERESCSITSRIAPYYKSPKDARKSGVNP